MDNIRGAEAILLHGANIVLAAQTEHRWLKKGDSTIIPLKTIGGAIEGGESPLACIEREILEEIHFSCDLRFDQMCSFENSKKQYLERGGLRTEDHFDDLRIAADVSTPIASLGPFVTSKGGDLHALFYRVRVKNDCVLRPKDVPALCIMPLRVFMSLDMRGMYSRTNLEKYMIAGDRVQLPSNTSFAFMMPSVMKLLVP